MILYHGTTLKNGREIISDGIIKSNIKRNYIDYGMIKNTTDGFVYLTKNLYTAYYYGNINLNGMTNYGNKYVYIFKINIDDNILLPDYDEIEVVTKKIYENVSAENSLKLCGCVTVKEDVSVRGMEYIILPATFNPLENEDILVLCRELSKLQLYGGNYSDIIKMVQEKVQWIKI